MACVGWASRWKRQGLDIEEFPHVKRWLETVMARPAVQRGMKLRVEKASKVDMTDPNVQALLFQQRAPSVDALCDDGRLASLISATSIMMRGRLVPIAGRLFS